MGDFELYCKLQFDDDYRKDMIAKYGESDINKLVSLVIEDSREVKRDFVQELARMLESEQFICVVGPRSCGKTVGLKQLQRLDKNSKYVNFKDCTDDEAESMRKEITYSIENDLPVTYLVDEVAYYPGGEKFLTYLTDAVSSNPSHKQTKVVMTGDHSYTLSCWCEYHFGSSCKILKVDFVMYNEWKKHWQDTSYSDYLQSMPKLYRLCDVYMYIAEFVNKTSIANKKSLHDYKVLDVTGLIAADLMAILIASLITLCNRVTSENAKERELSIKKAFDDFVNSGIRVNKDGIVSQYFHLKNMPATKLYRALNFLIKCDIVTVTPFAESLKDCAELVPPKDDDDTEYFSWLFEKFTVTVRHPVIYMYLIQGVLGTDEFDISTDIFRTCLGL